MRLLTTAPSPGACRSLRALCSSSTTGSSRRTLDRVEVLGECFSHPRRRRHGQPVEETSAGVTIRWRSGNVRGDTQQDRTSLRARVVLVASGPRALGAVERGHDRTEASQDRTVGSGLRVRFALGVAGARKAVRTCAAQLREVVAVVILSCVGAGYWRSIGSGRPVHVRQTHACSRATTVS